MTVLLEYIDLQSKVIASSLSIATGSQPSTSIRNTIKVVVLGFEMLKLVYQLS